MIWTVFIWEIYFSEDMLLWFFAQIPKWLEILLRIQQETRSEYEAVGGISVISTLCLTACQAARWACCSSPQKNFYLFFYVLSSKLTLINRNLWRGHTEGFFLKEDETVFQNCLHLVTCVFWCELMLKRWSAAPETKSCQGHRGKTFFSGTKPTTIG